MSLFNRYILLIFLSCLAVPASADQENRDSWFIEGRYQVSLYEGHEWKENEIDLGGASSNIITASSEKRDKLNSSGIAIGRAFLNKKIAISIAYEKFTSSIWSSGNFVSRDGRTFDSAHYPMKMHNYMLEASHSHPITKQFYFISLIGLGQAHIKTDSLTKAISGVSVKGSIAEKRITNLSKRIGTGFRKDITDNLEIISLLQYSDYGYAKTRCCTETFETFDTQVTALEAGIRVRYNF